MLQSSLSISSPISPGKSFLLENISMLGEVEPQVVGEEQGSEEGSPRGGCGSFSSNWISPGPACFASKSNPTGWKDISHWHFHSMCCHTMYH